jgi:hypothetical protein
MAVSPSWNRVETVPSGVFMSAWPIRPSPKTLKKKTQQIGAVSSAKHGAKPNPRRVFRARRDQRRA